MNINETTEKFDGDNKEFKFAEQLIKYSNKSIYLNGKAGTGKSTFLRYVANNTPKNIIILAPTGIAALNAGGVTIHSFFELPFSPFCWEQFNNTQKNSFYKFSEHKRKIIQKAELIIIDEISMVRADVVDAIDYRLRNFGGKKHLPFGGKQVLFVGDAFQLEPIAKNDEWKILKTKYDSPYFFSARTFKEVNFINIELKKIYRQDDVKFISILNNIRKNEASKEDLDELNKRYIPDFIQEKEEYITIATRKEMVDATNQKRLLELDTTQLIYEGLIEGKFKNDLNIGDDLLPTNSILELKKDAQVMFVKNDFEKRWVNGTIGKISKLEDNEIEVTVNYNGNINTYKVEKVTWQKTEYSLDKNSGEITEKVVGTFIQYPIKLAWAITIHKSQGLTFDKLILDMGDGAFSAGQTYVALSRCKNLEGIILKTPISQQDIIVNNDVLMLSEGANNEKLINEAINDSMADFYYLECIRLFDNSEYEIALEYFTLAQQYKDYRNYPNYKRLVAFKFFPLRKYKNNYSDLVNLNNEKINELDSKSIELQSNTDDVKNLELKLVEKDNEIIEIYKSIQNNIIKERDLAKIEIKNMDFSLNIKNENNTIEKIISNLVFVKGGSFIMGAQAKDTNLPNYNLDARDNEGPIHLQNVSDFYICKYLVTQSEFANIMYPSYLKSINNYDTVEAVKNYKICRPSRWDGEEHPVESINWYDCNNFIGILNKITKLNFSLPTEAQWEYAAKGGIYSNNFIYSGSNNFKDITSDPYPLGHSDVGKKMPNELGIFDMSGNVWEICNDIYSDKYNNVNRDVSIYNQEVSIRGGSGFRSPEFLRTTVRTSHYKYMGGTPTTGFRLVLNL